MGLRPLEIFSLLQCGDGLESSKSDVYRRQILGFLGYMNFDLLLVQNYDLFRRFDTHFVSGAVILHIHVR